MCFLLNQYYILDKKNVNPIFFGTTNINEYIYRKKSFVDFFVGALFETRINENEFYSFLDTTPRLKFSREIQIFLNY